MGVLPANIKYDDGGDDLNKSSNIKITFTENGKDVIRAEMAKEYHSGYEWHVIDLTKDIADLFDLDYKFDQPTEGRSSQSLTQEAATKIATIYQREKIVRENPDVQAIEASSTTSFANYLAVYT